MPSLSAPLSHSPSLKAHFGKYFIYVKSVSMLQGAAACLTACAAGCGKSDSLLRATRDAQVQQMPQQQLKLAATTTTTI